MLYEDYIACTAQVNGGYIKGDQTKHTSSKLLFHSWTTKQWWNKCPTDSIKWQLGIQ